MESAEANPDARFVPKIEMSDPGVTAALGARPKLGQKYGKIVNVASIAGKEGNPGLVPYSTAKAGVIGLTKALAKEVVTQGVYVNAVAPAVIETPILRQLTEQQIAYMDAKIPMGRVGKPEEVAAVVHFLASDDSSFVTGQCYDVSGGRATPLRELFSRKYQLPVEVRILSAPVPGLWRCPNVAY